MSDRFSGFAGMRFVADDAGQGAPDHAAMFLPPSDTVGNDSAGPLSDDVGEVAAQDGLTSTAGLAVFSASDGVNGIELWVTDGTAAGTMLLKDINPGANSSNPTEFHQLGDRLLFQASDPTNGVELWVTDGTAAGTVLLKDINPGTGNSTPGGFAQLGDKLLFRANNGAIGQELWVTDGTAAGTMLLKDIYVGSLGSSPFELTQLGDKIVFRANNGANGLELWVTDGTSAGTILLKDINPGSSHSTPLDFIRLGDKLLFRATDATNGTELWVTDGTAAGTILLKDINPGTNSSSPAQFALLGDKVLFRANDPTNGTELWVTDGTAAGTILLKDIDPGTNSSSPAELTRLGDKLLFRASDATSGQELWVTDGTAAGTMLLKDIYPGLTSGSPLGFTQLGDKLLFEANEATNGSELWVTDGTAAGTMLLKDLRPGAGSSVPSLFTPFGDKLLFQAFDSTNGTELWVTDGTAAGTALVKDILPGTGNSNPMRFTVFATSNTAPVLADVAASITVAENAAPTLLDADVTLTDDGNIANGRVTVSGLLAEDRVSIRNEGSGAGQIGVSGNSVTYGGVVIGNFTGGAGATFTVALNGSATVAGVEALIQNLTYANASDAPIASRTLRINVIDGAGVGIGNPASFTQLTGAANPFGTFDVGLLSKPAFIDFDNDGDLDLVSGEEQGGLAAFRNNGNGTYTQLTGTANPFNGFDVGIDSTPAAGDIDGDGDLDLLVGENDGFFNAHRNNGNGTFAGPIGRVGLTGVDFGTDTAPAFVDFDNDGDLDVVSGETNGTLLAIRNNGDGSYTQLTGAANPFNGIDVGTISAPSFLDFDADGDLDLLIGEVNGTALAYRNNGDGTFTNLTGAANAFNGLNAGFDAALAFADLDGDGDLDAVSGTRDGTFVTFRNDSTNGVPITVNVTAQNDAPTTANLQGDVVNYTEQLGQKFLDLGANATIADPDSGNFNGGSLRIQITAGLQAGIDAIFFVGNGRVSLSSQSAGATVFVQLATDASPVAIGTLANDNLFRNDTIINFNSDDATPARVQELLRSISYNGNSDTLTSGQRTITYTLNDGDGGISTTTSFVNVTAVNDLPVVTPGAGSATFTEMANSSIFPVQVASGLFLSDPDSPTFAYATVTISANHEGTDRLFFTNSSSSIYGNIIGSYDSATGVLTLTSAGATATRAQFQSALRAVFFESTSEDPSTATRTISFVANDGIDSSVASTRQLIVQARNDAPSGTSQTLVINEDQVRTLSESDFGFTDVDGDAFAGVRFNAAPTGGTLFFDADGPGVGNAPVAITTFPTALFTAAQLAAGQVTFVPTANLNGSAAASISFLVVDDGGTVGSGIDTDPTPNTLTFDITPQADAPVSADSSATFSEDTPYVFTLADFPFSDGDGDNFYSVVIDSHPAAGTLYFDPGGPNGTNRTDLTTFGTNFQVFASDIAAGKLFYIPAANGNGASYANFLFRVRSDNQPAGPYDSAQQTFTFNVTPVADAPVAVNGGNIGYTEGGAPATLNVTVSDPDGDNIQRATITIADVAPGDVLTVTGTLPSGITVDPASTATNLILIGNAAPSVFTSALAMVSYSNTGDNPTVFGTDNTRQIVVVVNDGTADSTPIGVGVVVTGVNDAPVIDLNGAEPGLGITYTFDEQGGGIVAPNATLADVDSSNFDGGSLTVAYASGGTATDVFSVIDEGGFFATGGRIGVWNGDIYYDRVLIGSISSGGLGQPLVIMLNSDATQAAVQRLVQQISVFNTSDTPPSGARDLVFTISDGDGGTSSATASVTINAINDAPSSTGFDNITYTEGDGVRNLDVGFNQVLTDPDSVNFDGGTLTVAITGNKVATEDQLTFTTGGTSFLSASGGVLSYNGVAFATYTAGGVGLDRVFTFNANATLEAVQTLMRNIAYININQADPSTQQRTVSYTLTDGDGGTLNLSSTIDVVGVNDAPVVDLNGADSGADNSASYTEQAPVVTLAADISLSDVDSATLTGATVQITGGFVPLAGDGADYLGIGGSGAGTINGITYSYSATTGILTLTGTASVAAYQAVLAQVTFQSTTKNPGASKTVTWTVNDGTANSAPVTTTITVTEVNDAPVNSVPGPQNGTEDTDLVFSSANGNAISVSDPDGGVVTVTLRVSNGTLTLAGTSGLTFLPPIGGDGVADSAMSFSGTVAAVNAALNGLIYRGNLNYQGTDTLLFDVDDGLANDFQTVSIALADDGAITGDVGNNSLDGTPQNDFFNLSQGGDDDLRGYEGDDGFYFGGAYDQNDVIDGGTGARDQIGLQGDYSAGVTLGSLTGVEFVVLLAGNDARFGGQTGTNLNYNIVANGSTIVSDNKLIVQANQLRAGESLTFDGSASAIDFIVYGGFGTDVLTGGSGNDGFFFGDGRFGANDVVNGGAGTMDQLGLQGNFSLTFGAGQMSGIELIALLSASDNRFGANGGTVSYDLTTHDNNVAAGQTMIISANTLRVGENLSFNGSAETNGRFEIYSGNGNDVIFGGAGNDVIVGGGSGDTLYGGGGNDIFVYRSVADSNATERDGIQDFFLGDRIDLSRIDANTSLGGDQDFTFVGTAGFTGTAGELRYQNISSGGPIYLVQGDVDGDGVSDLEIVLVMTDRAQLTTADFIGVNAPAQGAVPLVTEVDAAGIGLHADDVASPELAFIGRDHDIVLSHMTGDLLL